jgi:hypothetical protein
LNAGLTTMRWRRRSTGLVCTTDARRAARTVGVTSYCGTIAGVAGETGVLGVMGV